MFLLIIKSAACLAILMLFYKIVLESLSIHTFKRYYLLGAIIVSAVIPFITFITYVEPSTEVFHITEPIVHFQGDTAIIKESKNYIPYILYTIYFIGFAVFLIRFCKNLYALTRKIKRYEKVKNKPFIHVLIDQIVIPHTFLNYIFLNKVQFENNKIPTEVIIHEQAHAKQKHSLDILLVELLQVVFWFNPLLYFIKKDIKLNHEFLADKAVIQNGYSYKNYQNLLLRFSSNQEELALVNAINYSSIKKRFTVMKTQTSPKTKWLKSLLLLPLLAGLLLSFSKTKEVERRTSTTVVKNTPILVVNQNPFSLKLNKKNTSLETLKEDFSIITKGKKSDLIIDSNGEISHKTVFIIREAIGENLGRINMAEGSFIKLNSDNFPSLKVKKGEFSNIPTPPAPNQDLPIPPPIPENATPQQRAKMQATIDAYEAKSKRKVYTVKNTLTGEVDSYIINDEEYTNEERRNALQAREEALRKREENISRNHPAPPPPPKSPLDYVIDMAKKEATFTYNGKTVSSDKAIQLLKENDELSISSHEDNGVARVDISKKPIKTTNYSKSSSSSITTVRTDEPENAYAYIKSLEKDNISYFYNGKSVSYKKMLKIAKSEPVISISTHIDNGVGTAHFSSVKN